MGRPFVEQLLMMAQRQALVWARAAAKQPVVFLCVATALLACCGWLRSLRLTSPGVLLLAGLPPRPELSPGARAAWRTRHEADVARLLARQPGGCRAVLVGDSITEGWRRPYFSAHAPASAADAEAAAGRPGPGAGALVEGLGAGVEVFAVGGDRTEDLAWRLFEGGGAAALRACGPEAVVLLIGTNDFGRGEDVGVASQELRDLVAKLREALSPQTHLVLHALLPRATDRRSEPPHVAVPWGASNPAFGFLRQLDEVLRLAAAAPSNGSAASVVDCSGALLREGKLTREVFPDLLHLSEVGYRAWAGCLQQHIPPAAQRDFAAAEPQVTLAPQRAQVPPPPDGPEDPVEVLWQRPGGGVRAVVLMLHGCSHQGTDFWPSDKCSHCLGLPEEVRITRTVLRRGFLAMAVTSFERMSGCWALDDLPRVEAAVAHVYKTEALEASVPLYAFGASSGGAFVGRLAATEDVGRRLLKCRIPQIMGTPGTAKFSAPGAVPGKGMALVSWPAPPTLFIHMPRDSRTATRVATALSELWAGNVTAAELHCKPQPVADGFFAARIAGVSAEQSRALAEALRRGGFLDAQGLLRENPRASDAWREALLGTGVPEALGDSLEPDASAINEEMNVAWAGHEMCATHAEEMLDFCEDPLGTCAKRGWACGPNTGARPKGGR